MVWRSLLLRVSGSGPVRHLALSTALGRGLASRFVAGETLSQAMAVADVLGRNGATAQLDYLGENVGDASQAKESVATYLGILDRIAQERPDVQVSLKLTQMGLDLSEDLCMANVGAVVKRAADLGNFVWLDMEGSPYTQRTLGVYSCLRRQYQNVGVALQAALYRTEGDAERVLEMGGTVRLCKGAYLEPPAVAYPAKREVDRNFMRLTEKILGCGTRQAIATHDPAMIEHALKVGRERGLAEGQCEFQMLYGVRRDLQQRLVAQGHRLRVYVPFGTEWYPYLTRRLAERPANLLFLLSSLLREGRLR